MDFQHIKNLIGEGNETFVFVEGGAPEFVLLSFREYERLRGKSLPASESSAHPGKERPAPNNMPESDDFFGYIDENLYASGYSGTDDTPMSRAQSVHPSTRDEKPASAFSALPLRREDVRLEDLPI